jgi:hypothetical protein
MRKDIDTFIERIVDAAQIPSRQRRDELHRELRSHFEDRGLTPEAFDDSVACFGSAAAIGDSFRKVYRREYLLWYGGKVAACMAAATMAAILIEAIASLRVSSGGDAWQLSPEFTHAAGFGVVVTSALVAAAEATRAPLTWSRALVSLGCYTILAACACVVSANTVGAFITAGILATIGVGFARAATGWMARALLTLAAFTMSEYVLHRSVGIAFGPLRALAASAILLMLWASTIAIVAFSDRAFIRAFRST